jgi:hypothetical protein
VEGTVQLKTIATPHRIRQNLQTNFSCNWFRSAQNNSHPSQDLPEPANKIYSNWFHSAQNNSHPSQDPPESAKQNLAVTGSIQLKTIATPHRICQDLQNKIQL